MERPVIIRSEAFAMPIRRVVQPHPVDLAAVLHLNSWQFFMLVIAHRRGWGASLPGMPCRVRTRLALNLGMQSGRRIADG